MNRDVIQSIELPEISRVFDCLGDVVFCVKDFQGRYIIVNDAFADRVKSDDKSEVIGKTAEQFFPSELAETYRQQDEIVLKQGNPISDQLEQITNVDGTIGWYLASKFPLIRDGQVVGLVGISQDLQTPSDRDLEMANLKSTVEFIRQNLAQSFRTDQLASRVSMSALQLDNRMKRVFRLSTKKFIMKTRLEEATRKLIQTDDALSVIAADCGFADQSAFTRQFRSTTQMTPAAFRKQHQHRRFTDE